MKQSWQAKYVYEYNNGMTIMGRHQTLSDWIWSLLYSKEIVFSNANLVKRSEKLPFAVESGVCGDLSCSKCLE